MLCSMLVGSYMCASDLYKVEHFDSRVFIKEALQNMETFSVESKYNMAIVYDAQQNLAEALYWYEYAYYDSNEENINAFIWV